MNRLNLKAVPLRPIFTSRVAVLSLFLTTPFGLWAATIADFNTTGLVGSEASLAGSNLGTGVTSGSLTRGVGLATNTASNAFTSQGWEGSAASTATDEYYSFKLTLTSTYDFTSLSLLSRASNTGPGNLGLYYSGDGFASAIATFTQSGTTDKVSVLSLSALPNLTGNIEFRIIEIGNTSANGGSTAAAGTLRLANHTTAGAIRFDGTLIGGGGGGSGTFWDANGTTGGIGGTGSWTSTSTTWATTSAGTAVGTASTSDPLVFGGTAGTVTVGTVSAANGLQFTATGYQLTGGTLTLSGSTNSLTADTSVSASIASALAGSNGFTKDGAGSLTLSGANSLTGNVTINAGSLIVSGGSALADDSPVVLADAAGAAFVLNASEAIGTLEGGGSTGGNVTLNNGAVLTVNESAATSFAGVISGDGALTKTGTAQLTLSGANTFTGLTTVSQGTLSLGASNVLTGPVTVSGGTLALGSNSDTVGAVTLATGSITGSGTLTGASYALQGGSLSARLGAGPITVSTGTTVLSQSGRLNSTSTLLISGGQLTLAGAETVSSFTITGGTLGGGSATLTSPTYALQGGSINTTLGAGAVTVSGGTTAFSAAGRLNTTATLTVNSGQLTMAGNETVASLTMVGGTLAGTTGSLASTTAFGVQAGTISASLSGSVGLNKTTSGTAILSGANTYNGVTNVSDGTLRLNGTNRISASSALTLSGGELEVNGAGAGGQSFSNFSLTADSFIDLTSTSTLTFALFNTGTYNGTTALAISHWGAFDYTLRFFGDQTGNSTFNAFVDHATIDGFDAIAAYDSDTNYTNLLAVPEPSTVATLLSATALVGVLWRRRPRRR